MIRFQNPVKKLSYAGHVEIHLTERGTWNAFPEFARLFSAQLEAKNISQVTVVANRFWKIELNDAEVDLSYQEEPHGYFLMSYDKQGDVVLNELFLRLLEEKSEDGI